jgi:ABC-type glycerol-3-phosphate transport system permease component
MTTTPQTVQSSSSWFRSKIFRRSLYRWLLFLPLAFIIIIPLVYMFSMAFTLESNQLNFPIEWIPQPPTISNFIHIFLDTTLPIARWFANSLIVAGIGTVLIVFFSSLSGYAFARLERLRIRTPGVSWQEYSVFNSDL